MMTRTVRTLLLAVVVGFLPLSFLSLSGCSESPPYPQAQVASPEGRKGTCIACSREIPSVGADNLVTVGGIQFIVCGPECRQKTAKGTGADHGHEH
jgi:hypothetical protein